MAPQNIGASSQTIRKNRRSLREPHKTTEAEKEMSQREGIFDVDAIPSSQDEPVRTTLVKEEAQAPMMTDMKFIHTTLRRATKQVTRATYNNL
jgi:hypothetical protein